mmetsp:Transcript_9446/g.40889  ORF Transcript_9446/g.40889 Transcript_9446/m.40889 type:complete len:88 (+) Transcript_9446:235-498(+)
MIKGIIIAAYKSGGVLFQRYYGRDLSTVSAQARFLQKVRDTTAIEWPALVQESSEQVWFAASKVSQESFCRLNTVSSSFSSLAVCVR